MTSESQRVARKIYRQDREIGDTVGRERTQGTQRGKAATEAESRRAPGDCKFSSLLPAVVSPEADVESPEGAGRTGEFRYSGR